MGSGAGDRAGRGDKLRQLPRLKALKWGVSPKPQRESWKGGAQWARALGLTAGLAARRGATERPGDWEQCACTPWCQPDVGRARSALCSPCAGPGPQCGLLQWWAGAEGPGDSEWLERRRAETPPKRVGGVERSR